MRSLGYRPNTVARALATGRTRRIGVLAPATALYGPTSMLLSIETAARVAGYHLDIVRLRSVTRRSVTEAAQGLQSRGIDGIIGITPHTWAPKALQDTISNVPLVAVEGATGSLPTVASRPGARGDPRHRAPARPRARHGLARGGATRLGRGEGRASAGWRETLQRAGAACRPPCPGIGASSSGYDAGRRLADGTRHDGGVRRQRPDGARRAAGAARGRRAGARTRSASSASTTCPRRPTSLPRSPPCGRTSTEVGVLALKLLLDQIADGAVEHHVVVEPRLVVRQSAAPPPEPEAGPRSGRAMSGVRRVAGRRKTFHETGGSTARSVPSSTAASGCARGTTRSGCCCVLAARQSSSASTVAASEPRAREGTQVGGEVHRLAGVPVHHEQDQFVPLLVVRGRDVDDRRLAVPAGVVGRRLDLRAQDGSLRQRGHLGERDGRCSAAMPGRPARCGWSRSRSPVGPGRRT